MSKSKILRGSILVSMILLLPASQITAAELHHADSEIVRIAEGGLRNLYTAGANVIIDSDVQKDLVAAGGEVQLNSKVEDDLIVAGGNVHIRKEVGGSARVVAGVVNVQDKIYEDLVVAGGQVNLLPGSEIMGDLLVFGGTVIVDGPVRGNINFMGGQLSINHDVGGDVKARITGSMQLGPKARIKGNVSYTSRNLMEKDPGAAIEGKVEYTRLEGRSWASAINKAGFGIKVLGSLLLALLFYWLFRKKFSDLSHVTINRFPKNLAFGLLAFLLVPIVCVLLGITLVGLIPAILLGVLYVAGLILGWILGIAALGVWFTEQFRKEKKLDYISLISGVGLAAVISLIPVLGPIVGFILVLSGLGALVHKINSMRKGE